jgi:hypothetical protein
MPLCAGSTLTVGLLEIVFARCAYARVLTVSSALRDDGEQHAIWGGGGHGRPRYKGGGGGSLTRLAVAHGRGGGRK